MTKIRIVICALAVTGAFGCNKKKNGEAPKNAATSSAPGAKTGSAGGASTGTAGTPGTAEGEAPTAAPKVTECPKALQGAEKADRTITKECGVVPVTGEYDLDGTLTLEAGAQLAFRDGAEIDVGYHDTSKIIVKGTAEAPVVFTTSADKVPGIWKGLKLYKADRSTIDHLVIEFAGVEDNAALYSEAKDVTITNSIIRQSKGIGVWLKENATTAAFSGNTFDAIAKWPVSTFPEGAAGFGADNKYPANSVIRVEGGKVGHDMTWPAQGAPYALLGEVAVEGEKGSKVTLTIAPGAQLQFGQDVEMSVGYSAPGSLKVGGTKDQPVVFTAANEKKPGAGKGVRVYSNGDATIDFATFDSLGEDNDHGALAIKDGTLDSLKDSTFKGNTYGFTATDDAKVKLVDACTFDGNGKGAMFLTPKSVAALGTANQFGKTEQIVLAAGSVAESVTWHPQPAPFYVQGDVEFDVKGTVTLEAGLLFTMKEGTKFEFGYKENTVPKLAGTPDKPITFKGERDEAGSWDGVIFYDNVRDGEISNVVIRDAGVGIQIKDHAIVKATNVTGAKCTEAAIKWDCESKATTSGTKNTDGTPKGDDKPTCD